MATKDELVEQYKDEKAKLARVERAMAIQKERVQALAKVICEEYGKGPYDLGDGKPEGYQIQCRGGDTYYFVAIVPKGKKASTDA
jgi:hypothetical protein